MKSSRDKMKVSMVLVDLSINRWKARKKDKDVSKEIAEKHNTTTDAGNYRKNLLHKVPAPSYDAIATIERAARAFHHENTRPWVDGDLRILPNLNFMPYMERMRKFRIEFEEAVDVFVPDALRPEDGLFAQAKKTLNGMWKVEDYPNAAKLRARHDFQVRRFPFPDAEDFRVSEIDDAEIAEMKQETADAVQKAKRDTTRDIWQELYAGVAHVADVLASSDKKIMPTISGSLVTLAELLPRLNIEDDPNFTRMAAEVKAKLDFSPKLVRNSKANREHLAAEAERIAEQMKQYLG